MSFTGWGGSNSGPPLGNSTTPSGGMMSSMQGFSGWGTTGTGTVFGGMTTPPQQQQQQQQQDEIKFNSLFPVGGLVTGEQVKVLFQASGLPSVKLAQIWSSVDHDKDGKINKMEFCSAMGMIRQAQDQPPTASLPPSFAGMSSGVGGLGLRGDFSAPAANTGGLTKSWSVTGLSGAASPSLGSGSGQGWGMKPQDRGKYIMEFNSAASSNSGYLSGATARSILTKSGLDKGLLAQIWDLSDIDKDGRLSLEEYCIAMHLMTIVRTRGVTTLPPTLPAELRSSVTSATKFHTIDRATAHKKATTDGMKTPEKPGSVALKGSQSPATTGHAQSPTLGAHSPGLGGHVRNSSLGRKDGLGEEAATFEDRRKENFEAGRLELERRRRAIKEQQERAMAEKERKRREEEERRLQQEHEAELARQAELERQRKKAMEIEKEREEQMKKLAKKREEEEREMELKRKAEWARKRRAELEGQRDWEKKHLYTLRVQHSRLEDELRQLDQKKLGVLSSIERQKGNQGQIAMTLKSMRVSHDVRRAEITKLQTELNIYHSQLSVLQKQRRELREAMLDRSPEMSAYQQRRQELKDRIINLAASLAGMRSNITHNSTTCQQHRETMNSNTRLLVELKECCQKDEAKANDLRQHVLSRQEAAEETQRLEAQRRQEEETARMEAAYRREKEEAARRERDKAAREDEERLRREQRREKIRKEHEAAIKKAKIERVMASTAAAVGATATSSIDSIAPVSPTKQSKPTISSKPANLVKPKTTPSERENWEVEDDQVRKKVLELQKKKEELQKQREQNKGSPSKPSPYKGKQDADKKKDGADKGKVVKQEASKPKGKKDKKRNSQVQSTMEVDQQLLDLNSSWDNSGQGATPATNLPTDMTQILEPLKKVADENEDEDGTAEGQNSKSSVPGPLASPKPFSQEPNAASAADNTIPSEAGVKKFSVSRLSELFDKGLVYQQPSGWSDNLADTRPGRITSPLLELEKAPTTDYVNLDKIPQLPDYANVDENLPNTNEDYVNLDAIHTSLAQSVDTTPLDAVTEDSSQPLTSCQVLYSYQASDDTEVTITEGDVVTVVPRDDATPGWTMVRLVDGSEGWVPESYLELPEGGAQSNDQGGSGREATEKPLAEPTTGQASRHPTSPSNTASDDAFLPARVLFTWQGSKPNHLSLVKGEEVQVLKQGDKWWSGQSNGKIGWFPKTFVKLLEVSSPTPPPPVSPIPPLATVGGNVDQPSVTPSAPSDGSGGVVEYEAIYEYVGTTDGDLAFYVGDIIKVTSMDGVWWTGVLDDRTGTFPSNYVQPRPTANQASIYATPRSIQEQPVLSPQTPNQSSSSMASMASSSVVGSECRPGKPLIARVCVAFKSSKPGQLSLDYGELVKVLKQAPNGWWEGEVQSHGKKKNMGWFPGNRVELLPQRHTSLSSTSSSSSITGTSAAVGGVFRWMRARSPLLEALEEPKKAVGGASTANLVLALYTYTAQSSDELSFHKGSVISVLDKEGGDWWKGEVNDKVGLFPSNYVQPLTEQQLPTGEITRWADSVSEAVLQSVSDKERKRQEAIFELLTSERQYVDSLNLVKEVFFDPMAEQQILTVEEMAKVRVNWDDLIQCSTDMLSSFLVRLRTSGEVVRCIGDVLVSQIPHLTPHIRWCSCQLTACTLLQQKSGEPRFKEFEQQCSTDSRTGGLPLSSFLLKPMQRVTKYPLLIKRIVEYTTSADSDWDPLQQALEKAQTLCEHVNDGVQQKDNTEKLEWLQAHVQFVNLDEKIVFNSQTNFMGPRKLLHWGKFFKIRGSKDLVGFLFNDFLLLVRPKLFFALAAAPADLELWGKNEFHLYRKPYLLEGLKAKKTGSDANGALLSLSHSSPEEKDILLRVDTDNIRDLWVKQFMKASLDYITTKKKIEKEKQEKFMRTMRDSVGSLEVTVVEGVDLLAKDLNNKSDPFCVIKFGEQQEQTTPVINNNLNPKWNYTMQFAVHDINKDVLDISVFDKDLFSPNDFLGCAYVPLKDLLREKDSPWEKTVLLENVSNGEITLRMALTLNKDNLLL